MCNSTDRGYDICQEIRQLGRKRICELHFKENGALLGKGKVDVTAVLDLLETQKELPIVMVELDPDNPPMTPLQTVQITKDYLKKLGYTFRA